MCFLLIAAVEVSFSFFFIICCTKMLGKTFTSHHSQNRLQLLSPDSTKLRKNEQQNQLIENIFSREFSNFIYKIRRFIALFIFNFCARIPIEIVYDFNSSTKSIPNAVSAILIVFVCWTCNHLFTFSVHGGHRWFQIDSTSIWCEVPVIRFPFHHEILFKEMPSTTITTPISSRATRGDGNENQNKSTKSRWRSTCQ